MPARRRRPALVAALAALAVGGWVFRGLVTGGCLLQSDFHHFFEPMRHALVDAASRGQLTWTGMLGNGEPLLANPVYAVAYPPNLACLLGEPALTSSLLCALHLAWGGAGAWVLARERGAGGSAAWTAGAVFSLSGVALSSLVILNIGWPLAWLPWLLVAHGRLRRRRRALRPLLALAVVFAVLLVLGEPTLVGAAFLWVALAELHAVALARRFHPRRLRAVAGLALGVLLALPLLWPVARYLPHSVRAAGFEPAGLLQWSLDPLEIPGLLTPDLFGEPSLFGLEGYWAVSLAPDRAHPFFPATYLGALALCLAVAGTVPRGRRRGALLAWLALMGLLALGRHGPIFPLIQELPGVDAWRYPAKWLAPVTLPVALLAARGVDTWRRRRVRRSLLIALGLAGTWACALALLAGKGLSSLAWRELGPSLPEPDWLAPSLALSGWLAGLPLLGGALLLLAGRGRALETWTAPALAALVTLDLLVAGHGQPITVRADWYRRVPEAVQVLRGDTLPVSRLRVEPAKHLRWRVPPRTREEYFRWERDVLRLYTPVSFGLSLALEPDVEAMAPLQYATLGVVASAAPEREQLMLLGAAGVTHLAGFRERDARWTKLLSEHEGRTLRPLRVHRNLLAQPRARVVRELVAYGDLDELPAILEAAPDDFFSEAALVRLSDRPAPEGPPGTGPSGVRIVSDQGDELLLESRGAGGYLVVSDTSLPSWEAELDGRPVQMFRADVAFRGLVLPPGEHRIRMRHRTW